MWLLSFQRHNAVEADLNHSGILLQREEKQQFQMHSANWTPTTYVRHYTAENWSKRRHLAQLFGAAQRTITDGSN